MRIQVDTTEDHVALETLVCVLNWLESHTTFALGELFILIHLTVDTICF